MLKEYNDESDDKYDISNDGEQSDEAPELITHRSDFDSMVNDFLNNYEILGRKMRLKLEGGTGPEASDILRRSMGQGEQVRIADVEIEDEEESFLSDQEDEKAKWDCETILSMLIRPFCVQAHLSLI
jgi:protein LTV1